MFGKLILSFSKHCPPLTNESDADGSADKALRAKHPLEGDTRGAVELLAMLGLKLGAKALSSYFSRSASQLLSEFTYMGTANRALVFNHPQDPMNPLPQPYALITAQSEDGIGIELLAKFELLETNDLLRIRPLRLYWAHRLAEKGTTLGLNIRLSAEAIWQTENESHQRSVFDVQIASAQAKVAEAKNVNIVAGDRTVERSSIYFGEDDVVVVPRVPWSVVGGEKKPGWCTFTATVTEVAADEDKKMYEAIAALTQAHGGEVSKGLTEALGAGLGLSGK